MTAGPELLTVPETAARLGYGATRIYLMLADGRLHGEKRVVDGVRKTMITAEEVDRVGQPGPVVYTVQEVAVILRVSAQTIKRKIWDGTITTAGREPGLGGQHHVIPEKEVERLLADGF